MAISHLIAAKATYEETDNDDSARVVEFIIEQLELVQISKHGRHYSPGLTVFAYLIQSTSPAAYETIISQNCLCLPSVSTLKKITRRLNANEKS